MLIEVFQGVDDMLRRAKTAAPRFDIDRPVIAADKEAVVVFCEPVGAYEQHAADLSRNEKRNDRFFVTRKVRRIGADRPTSRRRRPQIARRVSRHGLRQTVAMIPGGAFALIKTPDAASRLSRRKPTGIYGTPRPRHLPSAVPRVSRLPIWGRMASFASAER